MKQSVRHSSLRLALAAVLTVASGTAAALGLGQIEVRSRAGQPLLAEIPVISNDPAELEDLQARLASPETFARIGLRPPQGAAAELEFNVGRDRAGRPVIRVTTQEPVNEPLLTFLIEVDWGQGRLVREYSALVATPQAVDAPVQPPIQAPVAAPSNVIQRPATGAPPRPVEPGMPASNEPRPLPAAPAYAQGEGEYGPVQRGDTLARIVSRLGLADGATPEQAMIAMLRANPEAFIAGDINQLKRGAVLRVPTSNELAAVDAAQASDMVRTRMQQWRQARREAAAQQAATAAAATTAATPAAPSNAATAPAPAPTARVPAAADARLEIAPSVAASAARAGSQTGIDAGGEGQMLRQELQETRETLAARDAQLEELKSRVAELEKLQADQQRLLSLKDSELAAAQQRLGSAGEPAAEASAPPAPARDSVLPWVLGAAALLALVLGVWRMRRRDSTRSAFRAPSGAATTDLTAAFPHRDESAREDLLVVQPPDERDAAVAPLASSNAAATSADLAGDTGPRVGTPTAAAAEPVAPINTRLAPEGAPRWHAGAPAPIDAQGAPTDEAPRPTEAGRDPRTGTPAPAPLLFVEDAPADSPDESRDAGGSVDEPGESADGFSFADEAVTGDAGADAGLAASTGRTSPTPPVENERIELAQAYIELGDHDSARQLLGEVAVTGDHASRQYAARLLRQLDAP